MNAAARIGENLAAVRGRIADAASRAGRTADSVRLVAVTKYVPTRLARLLVEAGCHELGESRPQELWSKAAELDAAGARAVRWHLVGHLQRNKVRRTLPIVTLIHTVDSQRLVATIDEDARLLTLQPVDVLIEVNISGDTTKTGLPPAEVEPLVAYALNLSGVTVRGLMGMASLVGGLATAKRDFSRLRDLRDRLQNHFGHAVRLDELSMGMSDDFEVAIGEGATIVRIGSALFEGVET